MSDHGGQPQISDPGGTSWAKHVGDCVPNQLNKNILEVILEKDNRGPFNVSESECAKLIERLGINLLPGGEVEGVQLCPNGRGIILITLKDHIESEKYCRYDVFEVSKSGIRATLVKQSGKREAIILIRGLHPNTKDSVVLNYLSKFGKVVNSKVRYGTQKSDMEFIRMDH